MSVGEVLSDNLNTVVTMLQSGAVTSQKMLNIVGRGGNIPVPLTPPPKRPLTEAPGRQLKGYADFCLRENSSSIIFIHSYKRERLLVIFEDGLVVKTQCRAFTKNEPERVSMGMPDKSNIWKLPFLFNSSLTIQSLTNLFAVSSGPQCIISGGHWDGSLQSNRVNNNCETVYQLFQHLDIVTAVTLSPEGSILATGSRDCTCLLWDISTLTSARDLLWGDKDLPKPKNILYGHDLDITCIDINVALDIIVTGSLDCTCIIHNLREGTYLHSLLHRSAVRMAKTTPHGKVVTYCEAEEWNELYIHSLNGQLLARLPTNSALYSIIISNDGDHLITGGESGSVTVYSLSLSSLNIEIEWKCPARIFSLAMLPITRESLDWTLIVGMDGSMVRVIRFDPLSFSLFKALERRNRDNASGSSTTDGEGKIIA
eukprot:TRINITY_DN6328_c0_g1_i7.p1 TRINITY_DN6328_c0_g1~~TRINITY_DN6328_c0_g1_i7.p1  ORF type:complete len:427 (-),score=66.08 TRINITY_DN6328_c0_g1_i7:53-1333(-)